MLLKVINRSIFVQKKEPNSHEHIPISFQVNNPFSAFTLAEPGGKGGCQRRHVATVSETAKYANCVAALNAGFFNDRNECLGTV